MKKTLLTILCAFFCAFAVAQSEKIYNEQYVVSVNGTAQEPQDAEVTVVDNGDGTINFVLKDFTFLMGTETVSAGDISLENIPVEEDEDGLRHFTQKGTYTIPADKLPAQYQALAVMFQNIPYTLGGMMNDEHLYSVLAIDMSKMGQVITVVVGSPDAFDLRFGTTYTEQLIVTVDGESSEPQDADVTVYDNEDGTIDFELKNFILVDGEEGNNIYVGTIYVENITTQEGEDGLTYFSYNGNIFIQDGDLEGVDMWYGPMLCLDKEGNPVGIPIALQGKMNEDKLFVTIDIDMQLLQQIVHVQLGTDDFDQPQREGKTYTEQLVVTVDGESNEPQDADVVVYDNEDGTIDFELKNFILSAGEDFNLYVGTIHVENIQTEEGEDGLTHFTYNGDIIIQEGDLEGVDMWYGPMLCQDAEGNPVGIPIVLQGKMNDDKLFATIDIEFGGQVIHVQLGTDDFAGSKKGDVNQDNTVDIADAVSILNAMAGQEVPGDADVNGDTVIDIADLVTVLNIMAGQ